MVETAMSQRTDNADERDYYRSLITQGSSECQTTIVQIILGRLLGTVQLILLSLSLMTLVLESDCRAQDRPPRSRIGAGSESTMIDIQTSSIDVGLVKEMDAVHSEL